MTKKEVLINDRKMIAKFMGLEIVTDGISWFDILFNDLKKYDESWDCLMPVVEKIENMEGIAVHIIGTSTSIMRSGAFVKGSFHVQNELLTGLKEYPIKSHSMTKIGGTYRAVLTFVKVYHSVRHNLLTHSI
jgi:hypothetical protein